MTQRDKTLKKWRVSKDEDFVAVEAVLKYYGFEPAFGSGSSHRTYHHSDLKRAYDANPVTLKKFGPEGQLTIPVSGGRRVIGRYLKNILEAIELVEAARDRKEEE